MITSRTCHLPGTRRYRIPQPSRCSPHVQIGSTDHRLRESGAVGALAIGSSTSTSPRPRPLSGARSTSLGKRARGGDGGGDDNDDDDSNVGAGGHHHHHHQHVNDNRGNLGSPQSRQSPKVPPSPVPAMRNGVGEERGSPVAAGNVSAGNGGGRGDMGASSTKSVAWSKSSLGNPDMAAVLRR